MQNSTSSRNTYIAQRKGRLNNTLSDLLPSLKLPSGHLVRPKPQACEQQSVESSPVLWMSDEKSPFWGVTMRAIMNAFPTHGLWPVVLDVLSENDHRPWSSGELTPSDQIEPFLPEDVLKMYWPEASDDPEEQSEILARIAPFETSFPGLAPLAANERYTPEAISELDHLPGRLGLIPTVRPADVLSMIGWHGPINLFDPDQLTAVLRSWEERFGAVVVGIGFATLSVLVHYPPDTLDSALLIAAEHYGFCPDNINQGIGRLYDYANGLVNNPVWSFWWD